MIDADLWRFWSKTKLYYFIFFIPSLSKNRFCTPERADIYRCCKQIQHFSKNLKYRLQHNAHHSECYHCQTKLFSSSYLLILFNVQLSSEYVLKQEFKPKYS